MHDFAGGHILRGPRTDGQLADTCQQEGAERPKTKYHCGTVA
jgi:hypothetical protein